MVVVGRWVGGSTLPLAAPKTGAMNEAILISQPSIQLIQCKYQLVSYVLNPHSRCNQLLRVMLESNWKIKLIDSKEKIWDSLENHYVYADVLYLEGHFNSTNKSLISCALHITHNKYCWINDCRISIFTFMLTLLKYSSPMNVILYFISSFGEIYRRE